MSDVKYLILVGGFWGISKELFNGRQVNPKAEGFNKVVDYILAIKGLPDEYWVSEGDQIHRTYYCPTHERDVPEIELENRFGCFTSCNQKLVAKEIKTEKWNRNAFEKYNISEPEWLEDKTYRIWCNNIQGREKAQKIFRYIDKEYPANKVVPMPEPVGNKMQWTIRRKDVPFVDLTDQRKTDETYPGRTVKLKEPPKEYVCPYEACDYTTENGRAFFMHKMSAHGEKKPKEDKKDGGSTGQ